MEQRQWNIAHNLAFDLVDRGTDPNELGKVITFLRQRKDDTAAKNRLMSLVQRLASSQNALIRSRQTQRFYRNIQEAIQKHLYDIENTSELLHILSWSLRLIRFYRVELKRAAEEQRPKHAQQQKPKQPSMKSAFLEPETEKQKIKVGDRVNVTILKKYGFKVAVQLETDEKEELIFEKPYYPGAVGAQVKLRVLGVNENGHVTRVVP